MKINVTSDHIAIGIRRHCTGCPVALAVADALERHVDRLHGDGALLTRAAAIAAKGDVIVDTRLHYRGKPFNLPPEVREFISLYDSGKPVQPFSFELELELGKPRAP